MKKGFFKPLDILLFISKAKYITDLAVSITDPPPIAIMVSDSNVKILLKHFITISKLGSGSISEKIS